jgi:hypothetical protein
MHRHRFSNQFAHEATTATPAEQAFVPCPFVLLPGMPAGHCPWEQVYQLAYEQARAVVAPSRLERYQRFSAN